MIHPVSAKHQYVSSGWMSREYFDVPANRVLLGFLWWVEWLGSAKRLAVTTFLGSCQAGFGVRGGAPNGAHVWLVPRRCLHPAPLPVKGTQ
jgi:hypothetical protein